MTVTLFIPCVPPKTTKQMDRTAVVRGRVVRFPSKGGKQAEETLTSLLAPHAPERPLEGPLRLIYSVTWPWRADDQKTRKRKELCQKHGSRVFTGKPDLDNFEKRLLDTLKATMFIKDDSLIFDKHGKKFVGDKPGISLFIQEVEDVWEG